MNSKILPKNDAKKLLVKFANRSTQPTNKNNLYIKNLPEEYTEQDVIGKFRCFGAISHVKMVTKSVALVRFDKAEDACQALLVMNGLVVKPGDQSIQVC